MGNNDKDLAQFGGKDKSRGIKHRKDKDKYRPKSGKDLKVVHQKSKQKLESNWDRYEKEDDSQNFQLTSSTDFSILANKPITQGQHFQFKQDKLIAEETDKTPHELFSLDLNMLNHSILTVPFYERVGINREYFTEDQLHHMKKKAETSLMKFNDKYNGSSKLVEEQISEERISCDNTLSSKEIRVVSGVQSISETNSEKSKSKRQTNELVDPGKTTKIGKPEEDLEQWLDDFLDQ